jgi:hypothetical protein
MAWSPVNRLIENNRMSVDFFFEKIAGVLPSLR